MVTINPLLTGRHHVVSTSIEGGDIGVCVKPSFRFWSIARSPYRCKDEWRQTFLESTTSFGICVNLLQAHTHTHWLEKHRYHARFVARNSQKLFVFRILDKDKGLLSLLVTPKVYFSKAFSRPAPCCNRDPEGQCWTPVTSFIPGILLKNTACPHHLLIIL